MALISRNTKKIPQISLTDLMKPYVNGTQMNWTLADILQDERGLTEEDCYSLVQDIFTEALQEWERRHPMEADALCKALCTKYNDGENILIDAPMCGMLMKCGFGPLSGHLPVFRPDLNKNLCRISRLNFSSGHIEEISEISASLAAHKIPQIYDARLSNECNDLGYPLFIIQNTSAYPLGGVRLIYTMTMRLQGSIRYNSGMIQKAGTLASCIFYLV